MITLFLSFLINVPFEVMIGRCIIAGLVGSFAGVLVGFVVASIASTSGRDRETVGERVDFTVGEEPQLRAGGPRLESVEPVLGGEPLAFQPLDFKSSAKHVQSLMTE
jgi:hypothetical protein